MLKNCTRSYKKKCTKCSSNDIKKDGFKRGKQRYKCKCCGYVYQNKTKKNYTPELLWNRYVFKRQTYSNLAEDYNISSKKVQLLLDGYKLKEKRVFPTEIILLIDTTYFGSFGIMAFKDSKSGDILKFKIVDSEKAIDYKSGVEELQNEGWIIKAIVSDGKKGLLGNFGDIPTQMCNFHQVQIITRYLTKRPKLEVNKELRRLALLLVQTDKESFTYWLEQWFIRHEHFLKEKTYGGNGKWQYTHRKTRSAYRSLKNNLKYLFTWYDYIGKLDIPNTTNALEGYFSHLKEKVRLHRGLKKERKIKVIISLLNK